MIITQYHTDHFGGAATKEGQILFPNAEYIISKADAEYIRGSVKDWALGRLTAIEKHLTLFDGEYRVSPGIRILPAYGHTPGHIIVDIQSNAHRLLYVADSMVHYLNFEHPEWTMAWEWDGTMASKVRIKLIEEAYNSGCLLHACHMPFPGLGYVTRSNGGYRWRTRVVQDANVEAEGT